MSESTIVFDYNAGLTAVAVMLACMLPLLLNKYPADFGLSTKSTMFQLVFYIAFYSAIVAIYTTFAA